MNEAQQFLSEISYSYGRACNALTAHNRGAKVALFDLPTHRIVLAFEDGSEIELDGAKQTVKEVHP